jgi:hypothetical protein
MGDGPVKLNTLFFVLLYIALVTPFEIYTGDDRKLAQCWEWVILIHVRFIFELRKFSDEKSLTTCSSLG